MILTLLPLQDYLVQRLDNNHFSKAKNQFQIINEIEEFLKSQ